MNKQDAYKKYARFSGVFKLIIGCVFSAFILVRLLNNETTVNGQHLFLLAVPMLFATVGLLELFSGFPFLKLKQAINALLVWQRIVIVSFIVLCVSVLACIMFR